VEKIAVIGAGTMGNGIAHTAAASGVPVTLIDTEGSILERAISTISANLQRGVDKGRMSDRDKQSVLARISTTTELQKAADAGLVVDSLTEHLHAAADPEHRPAHAGALTDSVGEAAAAKPGEVGCHLLRARQNQEIGLVGSAVGAVDETQVADLLELLELVEIRRGRITGDGHRRARAAVVRC